MKKMKERRCVGGGGLKRVSMQQSEGAIVGTVKVCERVSEQNRKFHSIFR